MNILIIGSGGREHALAWRCAQDNFVKNVFVCPGNAGTYLENKVSNVEMDSNDFDAIEKFCVKENIELVIIGPEQPLVMGLTDFLQSKNIKTFGLSLFNLTISLPLTLTRQDIQVMRAITKLIQGNI